MDGRGVFAVVFSSKHGHSEAHPVFKDCGTSINLTMRRSYVRNKPNEGLMLTRQLKKLIILAVLLICSGCAAMQVALEKKDLKVETRMSDTIFLDMEEQRERTVFVDIKNTSGKEIDITTPIAQRLQSKGYRLSANPQGAGYILQCNMLYVDKTDPSAARAALMSGYGSSIMAGAASGAVIGSYGKTGIGSIVGAVRGFGIGALAADLGETVSGALVKDVSYMVVIDMMISVKTSDAVEQVEQSDLKQGKGAKIQQTIKGSTNRKKYQARVVSTANQVNLSMEEALPTLTEGIARSIAGVF
ncbi:MAG: complement resistance protein TraT [Deltaproteobacteria bacterium]|nr:complement resistance protein TraT [Deltaproteobacteria bacterium]